MPSRTNPPHRTNRTAAPREPSNTTLQEEELPSGRDGRRGDGPLTLAVLWCPDEPWRIGEVALLPGGGSPVVLGRGDAQPGDPGPRLVLARATPSGVEAGLPIQISHMSRAQMVISTKPEHVVVDNIGRAPLLLNGDKVEHGSVQPGDTLQLGRHLLFLCVRRSTEPSTSTGTYPSHDFGKPDRFGFVGESLPIWRLRRQIAFLATRQEHVLVRGPSGSGKEVVARAIHALSRSGDRPMVSRSAATIPAGLVDAELYGNAKSYPNPGMPERPGLIGEANGGTLYLDEFGELPEASQAHLLRVLDAGEYQRLGETALRRSRFRLIAATNRPEQAIKEDLLARLPLRVELPGLDEHREDIPLLLVHLLRGFARSDEGIAARFFPDEAELPRISLAVVRALVQHNYRTNVRELEALLWAGIQASDGDEIRSVPALERECIDSTSAREPSVDGGAMSSPSATEIREALERNNGALEATWRALGLKNRYVLRRLLAKHGIKIRRQI
jgi:two-component system nitrogen regulation response regulator GlnG/two-component system response regulator HydG